MSIALFKLTIKKNWVLFVIFTLVLMMYSGVMISMYSPDNVKNLMQMFELFPPEMMKAFGFASAFTDMTGYLASWLYGLLMVGFPMVYSILLANKLVAKSVDNGSIACLLATPDSRVKIIVTKAVYALLSLTIMLAILFAFNVLIGKAMFPNDLNVEAFFNLNVTVLLVNLVVMSISFFFSCVFSETKHSIAFGAGIPIMFLLLKMLGDVSDKTEILKKISIFGWYDPMAIAGGETVWVINCVYLVIIVILVSLSVVIFNKKRLAV
ncbi:ABC transporter permease subunit [Anaerorhabdus sp.]|uniref:ABC transporter permease subunit n=1 Tax=Anaerorhabdus sp. TaxID=1872524 RepID=UPI002FCA4C9F